MKAASRGGFFLWAQKQRYRPDDKGGNRYLPAIAPFLQPRQAERPDNLDGHGQQ